MAQELAKKKKKGAKMTKTISTKRFFTLLKKLGYTPEDRVDLIYAASDGKTTSLRTLQACYPRLYDEMIQALQKQTRQPMSKEAKLRSQVIAAGHGYFREMGKPVESKYIVGIACRIAAVDEFDKISAERLRNIMNLFNNKKEDWCRGTATLNDITNHLTQLN